ncbi:MAG TPA: hypothetical protein VFO70_02855, partial [Chitinophagaceae bacterium]|nr:hypothetical protein [Chitinophagaceae bacterium]
MTSYLLLRNNKESGPYSLNELISQGLKAYDLVWVNGKSAAWRYPGEINELKEFSPPVEEQPYDRFFKKPSEQKPAEVKPVEVKREEPVLSPSHQVIAEDPAPIIHQQDSPAFVPKKSVFVTLPGQKLQHQPEPEPQPRQEQHQHQQLTTAEIDSPKQNDWARYQPSAQVVSEPAPVAKTITITENPVAAEVKYSQPLDEIKEMYVKTLQERKQKIAYKAFLLQSLKKVAVVMAIVGAGVLIGFTLKSNAGKKQLALNQSTTTALNQPAQQQAETLEEVKINQEAGTGTKEMQDDLLVQSRESSGPITRTNKEFDFQPETKPVPESNRSLRKEIISDSQEEEHYEQPASSVEVDASTGERKRTLRNSSDPVTTKTSGKAHSDSDSEPGAILNKSLSRFVTVKSNDYKIVAFG